MKIIYTIVVILLLIFVVDFSMNNSTPIQFKYRDLIDFTLPAYMLIFVSFLAGVIFAGIMGIVERFRLSRTINELNRAVRDLKRELRSHVQPTVTDDNQKTQTTGTSVSGDITDKVF
ncbi:MAG: LapA family protein [Syntrophales bacterium]|nr:LapA family protein [Syntrophales bacterium]